MKPDTRERIDTRDAAKDDRLEARVSKDLKALFQRAADYQGVTLSHFMISTLVERSRSTIREHEIITLSGRNRTAFLDALANPPTLTPKFIAAYRKLKELQNAESNDAGGKSKPGKAKRQPRSDGVQQRKRSA